jgi:hypothetical protein
MKTMLWTAVGPALFVTKATIAFSLAYCAVALRSSFLLVFAGAVGLISAGFFLDLNTAVGQEADIVISLLTTVCFAAAILVSSGAAAANPTSSVALLLALMGAVASLSNAVHANKDLLQIFDAASSCFVVVGLGGIVALLCSGRRPRAAIAMAAVTFAYGGFQAEYFKADFQHHQEALGALTALYCAMVGALFVDGNLDGEEPKVIFAPRRVFIGLRDAISAGVRAVAAFASRSRS